MDSLKPGDVVICATGYQTTLPFLDCRLLGADSAAGVPRLFLNLLHPARDDIAVVGLIQPDSGQWGITDVQARLVAGMAAAARRAPKAAAWLYARRQQPARPSPIRYDASPRHTLEVEHFSYRRELERLVAAVERRLRLSFLGPAFAPAGCAPLFSLHPTQRSGIAHPDPRSVHPN